MTLAYSYIRFSTPEQMQGDSLRRQTEGAERYCATHGLTLDKSLDLRELGTSAFRGRNIEGGAFALFRRAIEDGIVPKGSVLIVENLDRLSRMPAYDAFSVLSSLINAGVDIVTLKPESRHSLESLRRDMGSLITVILQMQLGYDESQKKSFRMRDAWSTKQKNAATKPVTLRTPAWITLDKTSGTFSVNEEKAEVVRTIYQRFASGTGQDKIARQLNEEGVAPFGKSRANTPEGMWRKSSIHKVLTSDTVIGTYTPTTTEEDPLTRKLTRRSREPVPGYYPAVVDPELHAQVRAMLLGKTSKARGKDAFGLRSMLGGICFCSRCGSSVTRRVVGRPGAWARLVCTTAKLSKGCVYETAHQGYVESALVSELPRVLSERPLRDAELDHRLQVLDNEITGVEATTDALIDELSKTRSSAVREKLMQNESLRQELVQQRERLADDAAAATIPAPEYDPTVPSSVNALLRTLFSRVELDLDGGRLWLHWRGSDKVSDVLVPELYGKTMFKDERQAA